MTRKLNCRKCGKPYLFKKAWYRAGEKIGTVFAHEVRKQKDYAVLEKSCKLLT